MKSHQAHQAIVKRAVQGPVFDRPHRQRRPVRDWPYPDEAASERRGGQGDLTRQSVPMGTALELNKLILRRPALTLAVAESLSDSRCWE